MSALSRFESKVHTQFLQINTKIEWSSFRFVLPDANDVNFSVGLAMIFSFIVLLGKAGVFVGDISESLSFTWKVIAIVLVSVEFGIIPRSFVYDCTR